MAYDLDKLDKLANRMLSEKRYYHTRCVAKQAALLAKRYGCDENKAQAAGWLHDICKEMPRDEQLQWASKFGIIFDSIQEMQPNTWHGLAACGFIKTQLGISDIEMLDAVRYHTTARARMTKLDEVVYLADLTGADRDYPDIAYMCELALKGTRPAMRYALRWALGDLIKNSQPICRDSWEAYNFYMDDRFLRPEETEENG